MTVDGNLNHTVTIPTQSAIKIGLVLLTVSLVTIIVKYAAKVKN